jgi:hypothetical protein
MRLCSARPPKYNIQKFNAFVSETTGERLFWGHLQKQQQFKH